MPPARHDALVVCTCGQRWGSLSRFRACEEMGEVELGLIAAFVPKMKRHWELRHHVAVQPGAPLAAVAAIAKAAQQLAAETAVDEASESGGNSQATSGGTGKHLGAPPGD